MKAIHGMQGVVIVLLILGSIFLGGCSVDLNKISYELKVAVCKDCRQDLQDRANPAETGYWSSDNQKSCYNDILLSSTKSGYYQRQVQDLKVSDCISAGLQ
ncbi:hypothetical protein HZB02_06890 [Candidatus Woesearchaeota archaeon]|nr:hypothetical protein [Candidatus Woesearchaeota archaeon]